MLQKLRIKNFQSFSDVTYNFSDGLNVIIADNNTGKSIIFKLLDLMINFKKYKSKERLQFVRFGFNKSDCYFWFSDEIYWVEVSSKFINYYSGKELNSMKFLGNEIPESLKTHLGLLVCEDGLIGNLIDENQSKFLINSDSKINNSILGLFTKDSSSEKVIELSSERLKELNASLKIKTSNRDILRKELSKIKVIDVGGRERTVKNSNTLINFVDILLPIKEKLSSVHNIKPISYPTKSILELTSSLESVRHNLSKIYEPKEKKMDLSILEFISCLDKIDSKLDKVKCLSNPSNGVKVLNLLSGIITINSTLSKITYADNLSSGKLLLNMLENLDRVNNRLLEVKSLKAELTSNHIKCYEILSSLHNNLLTYSDIKSKLDDSISLNISIKDELNSIKGEVLDCPIYGSIKFVDEKCIPYSK